MRGMDKLFGDFAPTNRCYVHPRGVGSLRGCAGWLRHSLALLLRHFMVRSCFAFSAPRVRCPSVVRPPPTATPEGRRGGGEADLPRIAGQAGYYTDKSV